MFAESAAQFPAKLECLFKPKRFKILYGGRGAGRSWGIARALLIMGAQRSIRVLCAREFQNSIADSVHKLLSDQIAELGLEDYYEIQQQRIIGRKNGTSFAFEGIKNNTSRIKSYEGIDYCWIEEGVKVSRASWGILTPTIRKEGSEIWVSFNPELDTDYTYQRFVVSPERIASTLPGIEETGDSFIVKMTWRDNPFFPPVLRADMEGDKKRDYDHYLNAWEGHTIQMLEGVVYAKELRRTQEDGRICSVPYDRTVPVNCYWDLGRADNTAIWFAQRVAMQWRILAYFEDSGEDVGYFLKELQRRPYVYSMMYLPHDAKAKKLGSKLSIEEQIRAAGFKVTVLPKLSVTDGINAARLFMPSCWFDEQKCADGLNALRHYRYKVLEGVDARGKQQLANEPLHDWASDGADAFRYMAIASNRGIGNPKGSVLERLEQAKAAAAASFKKEIGRGGRASGGTGWLNN